MMKSVALSESCLFSTSSTGNNNVNDDFVLVEAPKVLIHSDTDMLCLDKDDDSSSYDYCEDAMDVDQDHFVPFIVERQRGSYDYDFDYDFDYDNDHETSANANATSTFKSILIDSTSMTSSFFLAEMAKLGTRTALDQDQHPVLLTEHQHQHRRRRRLTLIVDVPEHASDEGRQSSAERCASDSPNYRASGNINCHESFSLKEEHDSSGQASAATEGGDSETETGSDSSVFVSTRSTPNAPGLSLAAESPALMSKQDADVTIIDGTQTKGSTFTIMKFKRLSNKKRRRQLKLARKAAAAVAATAPSQSPRSRHKQDPTPRSRHKQDPTLLLK